MTPKRVRLSRKKGARVPEGAVNVARPTRWGNPFAYHREGRGLVRYGPRHEERFGRAWDYEGRISANGSRHDMWFSRDDIIETYVRWGTRAELVDLYRLTILDPTPGMVSSWPSAGGHFLKVTAEDIRNDLAGRDLACWCKPEDPCHADVLLDLANRPAAS